MYIANSRVRHFRSYLLVIKYYLFVHRLCSATCHILNVSSKVKTTMSIDKKENINFDLVTFDTELEK